MSVQESFADDGILNRVITRVRECKPLDTETVERARAVMKSRDVEDIGLRKILEDTDPSANTKGRVVSRMNTGADEVIEDDARWPYAGLAPMTRVRTSFGDVYAVALRKGDLVKTRSGEFKPIVWLDRIMLDGNFLENKIDANPIVIPEGALARGLPRGDVALSPRQIIAEQSDFLNATEAGDLTGRPNIRRKFETGLSYTVFHLGQTEDILCEGMFLRIEV